jgi:hypothetical protein
MARLEIHSVLFNEACVYESRLSSPYLEPDSGSSSKLQRRSKTLFTMDGMVFVDLATFFSLFTNIASATNYNTG